MVRDKTILYWIIGLLVLIYFMGNNTSTQAITLDDGEVLIPDTCKGDNTLIDGLAEYVTDGDCGKAKGYMNAFFAFAMFAFFAKIAKTFSRVKT